MRMKIRVSGVTPQMLEKDIKFKFVTVKKGLSVLARLTQNHMRTIIKSKKKRAGSKGNLEKNILVYEENSKGKHKRVGVGLISHLNKYAPYWSLINRGGLSGVAKQGKWVPGYFGDHESPQSAYKGTGKGTQQFFYTPYASSSDTGPTFFMKVESPIKPMFYIEKTATWLNTKWKVHFYNWTKKTVLK